MQVPVLPLDAVQATIDMVSQFQYLETDILKGYRFVARETQGLNPVINWNLFYFFVGMTFDQKYLVTMMVPVTSQSLQIRWKKFLLTRWSFLIMTLMDI